MFNDKLAALLNIHWFSSIGQYTHIFWFDIQFDATIQIIHAVFFGKYLIHLNNNNVHFLGQTCMIGVVVELLYCVALKLLLMYLVSWKYGS